MKRWGILFCTILFLTMLQIGALAEGTNYTLLSDHTIGNIMDFCEEGNVFYLLSDHGVFQWSSIEEEPERIVDLAICQKGGISFDAPSNAAERELWEKCIGRIFMLDGQLMGLHPYTGQVFLIQDGEAAPLMQLPQEQFFYTDQDELVPKNIVGCVAQDGVLYLALNSFTIYQGERTELYAWTPTDEVMRPLEAPGLTAIYPGVGNKLLVRIKDDATIRLYDAKEQTYDRALWTETGELCGGYAWDAEADMLYYTSFDGAVQAVSPDGKTQVKAYLPINFAAVNRARILPNHTYIAVYGGSLFMRPMDINGEAERITLRINGLPDANIMTAYAAEHPDIDITSDYDATDFLSVQQSIVSGDSSIDLFMLNSNGSYAAVRDKGYVTALSASSKLAERAGQCYPAIRDILMRDGELVAYPAWILMENWTVNETQWQAFGFGEYPSTIQELLDLMTLWDAEYAEEYPNFTLFQTDFGFRGMIAFVVHQYLLENEIEGQMISFESAELRQLLTTLLDHRDLFSAQTGDRTPLIMPYAQYFGSGGNDSDTVISIMPPCLSEDSPAVVFATLELYVLNPRSQHPQEAIEFLEYYAEHMDITLQYSLSPEGNVPLRPDWFADMQESTLARIDYFTQSLETLDAADQRETQEIIEQERQRYEHREEAVWAVSQESINIQRAITENLVIPLYSIYTNDAIRSQDEVINEVIALFVDGRLTVDQFIKTLNDKAMMMIYEGV